MLPARRVFNWTPFGPFGDELDRFFGEVPATRTRSTRAPAINVWEDENSWFVEAEVPGVSQDELDISIEENELTVRGEWKQEDEKEERTMHRREIVTGQFERTVRLPESIQADKVDAVLKNGVLRLTLPKAQPEKAKRIKVNVQ